MYNNTNINIKNENKKSYLIENIIMIIILFLISFISGYFPLKSSYHISKKLIGIMKGFKSGIFLSITFFILFPKNKLLFNESKNNFSKSILFALIGYLIIFYCESILSNQEEKLETNQSISYNSNSKEKELNENKLINYFSYSNRIIRILTESYKKKFISKKLKSMNEIDNRNLLNEEFINGINNFRAQSIILNYEENFFFQTKKNIYTYFLIFTFTIHNFFEGIILSFFIRFKKEFFILLISICYHKIVELICFGLVFSRIRISKKETLKFITFLSCCCPIGIIFGNLIVILQIYFISICSGTFLYISTTQVMTEEFSIPKYKKHKFIGFLMGILIILLIAIF